MIDKEGREWLTIAQLAAVVGVRPRTINTWMRTGKLDIRDSPMGRAYIALDSVFKPRRTSLSLVRRRHG